jgi:hypothetical protein
MSYKQNTSDPVVRALLDQERDAVWLSRKTQITYGRLLPRLEGMTKWHVDDLANVAHVLGVDILSLINHEREDVAS